MLRTHPGAAAAIGVAITALIGLIIWLIVRHRRLPKNLRSAADDGQPRRRTIEGEITDADTERLYYTYSVRGVEYAAAQEVGSLLEFLPCEPARVVGEVSVRYLQNNAANSIIVCEEWSGLSASQYVLEREEAAKNEPAY